MLSESELRQRFTANSDSTVGKEQSSNCYPMFADFVEVDRRKPC